MNAERSPAMKPGSEEMRVGEAPAGPPDGRGLVLACTPSFTA